MQGNDIRIILSGILVSVMLLFGCPDFLHQKDAYVALTYHLFHANIFHLATNLLSVWLIFRRCIKYRWQPIALAYVIAVISWYFTPDSIAGISNMVFAYLGLRTPSLRDGWWRQSAVITFLVVTVAMAFLPNVSGITHIVSFILGCACAAFKRILNSIASDYRRASYHQ